MMLSPGLVAPLWRSKRHFDRYTLRGGAGVTVGLCYEIDVIRWPFQRNLLFRIDIAVFDIQIFRCNNESAMRFWRLASRKDGDDGLDHQA
jgi:hypothetical protein